ncbi:MAG: hypothetical protein Q8Q15_02295 [bacterium]|nr:hypothetical protein [bacterium]
MELSNVLTKLSHRDAPEQEYFWALEIWSSGVKSAIWTIENEKTKVIVYGSEESWQGTADDLISAADRSLASASEKFGETEGEPSKVVFGLPYDWLEGEKIIASWQQMLQTLCEKLDLSPLGFVLTIDALNHQLKSTEGIPPSVILVSPHEDQVLVALVKQGKVEGVESVRRSETLSDDVFEGLSRFEKVDSLPSRILLFDGKEMETARENLIDFPWQAKLSFLHLPKIEMLSLDFDIASVCLSGGSEVARSLGFKVTDEEPAVQPTPTEKETLEEALEPAVSEEVPKAEPDFGFVKGKDILDVKPLEKTDDLDELEKNEQQIPPAEVEQGPVVEPELVVPDLNVSKKPSGFLSFLKPKLPHFSLPLPGISTLGIIILAILLISGGAVWTLFWGLPRAEVIISVSSQSSDEIFELTVDPNQEVSDGTNFILPGKAIEAEASGDKSVSTTGKKTVGEKAKGEITIFNTGGTRNLSQGTTLTGPGGLKFTLDNDVSVGSGSAVVRKEVNASITAANIGAEYNLAGDSEFTIANLDKSVIGAKSNTALSGGTSRQIQAVSEEDQKNLLASLTEDLSEKAKAELSGNIPEGKKLIEESLTTKEVSRSFDKKTGDESPDLGLSLRIKAQALTFSQDEFLKMVENRIISSVPEGYEINKENISSDFEVEKQEKDGSVVFKVGVKAGLLPKLNLEEIVENIKGKYPDVAREYLGKLPGFAGAEINITPLLPAKIMTLPRVGKNIKIEMRSE